MKLFVGNLSFDATDTDLMDLFSTLTEKLRTYTSPKTGIVVVQEALLLSLH